MKKIAVILFNNYDRDLRVIREVQSLRAEGYIPTVFCSTNNEGDEKKEYKRNGIRVVKIVDWLPYVIKNPLKFAPYFKLKRIILQYPEKFDLIHCHDLNASIVGYALVKKMKIPLVCDFHELFIDYLIHHKPNRLKKYVLSVYDNIWSSIGKKILRSSTAFITVNNSLAEIYQDQWKLDNDPIVLYNYSSRKIRPSINLQKNYFRDKYAISKETRVLIFQGSLFYDKGIEVILDAFCEQDKYAVVFLGMGALVEKINYFARTYPGRFFYHCAVPGENLLSYTKCADAGLAPIGFIKNNHLFSSPNKVFEYIAAGIPFVCSDLPEMRKIVKDTEAGFIVPPNNPKELLKGVERIFYNKNDQKMRAAARKAFKEKYSWEIEQNKLIEVYRNILGN